MRFATFAAFMLPLAALAAPVTVSDLAKISDPLGRTSVEVESVISQLLDHKDSPDLLRALQTAQLANTHVFFGTRALVKIINANADNGTLSDAEYVDSLCVYMIVQMELTRRFCSQRSRSLSEFHQCPLYLGFTSRVG